MMLLFFTHWNLLMSIGFIVAIAGMIICFGILMYCFISMDLVLKEKNTILPINNLYRLFIITRDFKNHINSTSDKKEKDRLIKKLVLTKRTLIITPVVLIIGLLIMVVGKSLM